MISEVTLSGKAHVAIGELTLEGLLPVMYAHVSE